MNYKEILKKIGEIFEKYWRKFKEIMKNLEKIWKKF